MGRLPPVPPALKALQKYLRIADDFDRRDQIVSFYCRSYAAKLGIEKFRTPQTTTYLMQILDAVEADKKVLKESEALNSEVVAQSNIWNVAMKLFAQADTLDRAGKADKKVSMLFFTAMVLFEVLGYFGEMDEDVAEKHKYAKWKAAHINQCLRDGVTPIPGPVDADGQPLADPTESNGGMTDDVQDDDDIPFKTTATSVPPAQVPPAAYSQPSQPTQPPTSMYPPQQPQPGVQPYGQAKPASSQAFNDPLPNPYPQSPQQPQPDYRAPSQPAYPQYPPQQPPPNTDPYATPYGRPAQAQPPPQQPQQPPPTMRQSVPVPQAAAPAAAPMPIFTGGGRTFTPKAHVTIQENDQATKFCKFAVSALQYSDTKTAVENMLKALNLLCS